MAIHQMGEWDETPWQMGGRHLSPTHQMWIFTRESVWAIVDAWLSPEEKQCLYSNISHCSGELQACCWMAQSFLQQNTSLDPEDVRMVNALQTLFLMSHFRGVDISNVWQYFLTYGASLRAAVEQVTQVHGRVRDLWRMWWTYLKT